MNLYRGYVVRVLLKDAGQFIRGVLPLAVADAFVAQARRIERDYCTKSTLYISHNGVGYYLQVHAGGGQKQGFLLIAVEYEDSLRAPTGRFPVDLSRATTYGVQACAELSGYKKEIKPQMDSLHIQHGKQ